MNNSKLITYTKTLFLCLGFLVLSSLEGTKRKSGNKPDVFLIQHDCLLSLNDQERQALARNMANRFAENTGLESTKIHPEHRPNAIAFSFPAGTIEKHNLNLQEEAQHVDSYLKHQVFGDRPQYQKLTHNQKPIPATTPTNQPHPRPQPSKPRSKSSAPQTTQQQQRKGKGIHPTDAMNLMKQHQAQHNAHQDQGIALANTTLRKMALEQEQRRLAQEAFNRMTPDEQEREITRQNNAKKAQERAHQAAECLAATQQRATIDNFKAEIKENRRREARAKEKKQHQACGLRAYRAVASGLVKVGGGIANGLETAINSLNAASRKQMRTNKKLFDIALAELEQEEAVKKKQPSKEDRVVQVDGKFTTTATTGGPQPNDPDDTQKINKPLDQQKPSGTNTPRKKSFATKAATFAKNVATEMVEKATEELVGYLLTSDPEPTCIAPDNPYQCPQAIDNLPCTPQYFSKTTSATSYNAERDNGLQHAIAHPTFKKAFAEKLSQGLVRQKNELASFFDNQSGSQFDHQIHKELCGVIEGMTKLAHDNYLNPYPEAIAPVVYQMSAVAELEHNPEIKTPLTDFCHHMLHAAQGAVDLTSKIGLSTARVAQRVFRNELERKKEFVMGMLSHPIDTLYKEFVQPLEMAGKCLGKAVYLACTDPARLARAGIRNVEQLTTRAHQDPEGLIAATVRLFVSPTASAAKIINFKGIVNAIKENHRVAIFVQKTKKTIEHGKQAVLKPLAVVGEQAKEAIQWTHHRHKHVPPKGLSWKQIVQKTKTGDAMYKPEINIKQLEEQAWNTGTQIANGRSWKVKKFNNIIGAKSGKETFCMRVEMSANTIHGHPITEEEFKKLLKDRRYLC